MVGPDLTETCAKDHLGHHENWDSFYIKEGYC